MKKLILILLLFAFSINTNARIGPKTIDQVQGQIILQNLAAFVYTYSGFQIAINSQIYTIDNMVVSGSLVNMAAGALVIIALTLPPESTAGASISIWYPGSLPGNATPANLVDFMQYGSAGNPYESVAVQAGIWPVGAFVSAPFPLSFSGTVNDYGPTFWGTFTGTDNPIAANDISIYPNPCVDYSIIDIPNEIIIDQSIIAEIYNAEGKLMEVIDEISDPVFKLNTSELQKGFYFVRLMNAAVEVKTLRFVKQ